jgi:hypothetical protein
MSFWQAAEKFGFRIKGIRFSDAVISEAKINFVGRLARVSDRIRGRIPHQRQRR